uniref:BTB domain containing 16 n=1 Tax=Podarcis muralis TaxID=64176 RepID=A0A670ICR0_PODMU
ICQLLNYLPLLPTRKWPTGCWKWPVISTEAAPVSPICLSLSPPSDVTLECLGFQWELHRILPSFLMLLAETRCYKQRLLNSRKSKELLKQKKTMPRVTIALEVNDPDVTRFAFAVALKNLYNSELEVNEEDVLGVLATAEVLQFPSLFQK